jgi:serine/threonine protein kinase
MSVGVKVLHTNALRSHEQQTMFLRELELMTNEHPAIQSLVAWGIRENQYCLVTKRMETNLEELLRRRKGWHATGRSIAALGIAAGMAFLHSKGIIHRDLKPENVLVSAEGYPRIADFGFARCIPKDEQVHMTGGIGTALYMAPELFDDGGYNTPVDVYAWSFIVWRLITGNHFFDGQIGAYQWGLKVLSGTRPDPDQVKDAAQRDLLVRCWDRNPSARPTFIEILENSDVLMISGCDPDAFNAYKTFVLKL